MRILGQFFDQACLINRINLGTKKCNRQASQEFDDSQRKFINKNINGYMKLFFDQFFVAKYFHSFFFSLVLILLIANSAKAAMVRLGFTPGLAGMIDPSMTYRPG